jgi:hypothetical protein
MAVAHEKKDGETVNGLFQKIETLGKTLGPKYVALIDGVQDIAENRPAPCEVFVGIWNTRQAVYEKTTATAAIASAAQTSQ